MSDALVIGGGPAGLMAASTLSEAGHRVTVADQMPSLGRKLLMAGKSGLNLTRREEAFTAAYGPGPMADLVTDFGPTEVEAWANALGQTTFAGSTGRVFPTAMKASPLLRAWLATLRANGTTLHTRWRWIGLADGATFDTPTGRRTLTPDVTVIALGGASWRRLGSDGAWAEGFAAAGLPVTPFAPSNVALTVAWSGHMAPHFGQPLKGVTMTAGDLTSRGEAIVTRHGLEGGGIYALTPALRAGAPLTIDLKPDWTQDAVATRYAAAKGSIGNRLRKSLRLAPPAQALLMEFARHDPAAHAKSLTVPHQGPRPMDDAISTAGGLAWPALDGNLMLHAHPGHFAAGEMLDWEAPTGGYLLTACLASGRHAGRAAARWLDEGHSLRSAAP